MGSSQLLDFPMEHKHNLFLKQAGIITQLLENLPQLLILATACDVLHAEKEGLFGISDARWTEVTASSPRSARCATA